MGSTAEGGHDSPRGPLRLRGRVWHGRGEDVEPERAKRVLSGSWQRCALAGNSGSTAGAMPGHRGDRDIRLGPRALRRLRRLQRGRRRAPAEAEAPREGRPPRRARCGQELADVWGGGTKEACGIPAEALCPVCCGLLERCVALVPCGHAFCSSCAASWLQCQGFCPICRAPVGAEPRCLRVRVVDDLVQALSSRAGAAAAAGTIAAAVRLRQEAADAAQDTVAPHPDHEAPSLWPAAGPSSLCGACCAKPAHEACGSCGEWLGLCRSCAQDRIGQCEACEGWFCSDWCAARPCVYCARPHVCAGCRASPLRRCPRPEC